MLLLKEFLKSSDPDQVTLKLKHFWHHPGYSHCGNTFLPCLRTPAVPCSCCPRALQSSLNTDAWPKACPVSLLICGNRLTSVSHFRLCGTCSSLTCTMPLPPTQTWANQWWQQCSYDTFILHASSAIQAESAIDEYFSEKGVTIVTFSRYTQLELRMIFSFFQMVVGLQAL